MDRETAMLNKIYRAVHDGVCPRCGADMITGTGTTNESYCCTSCLFQVTFVEMSAMKETVMAWGREAVKVFEEWRNRRSVTK